MKNTIKEMVKQADDERNFDLIRWIKDILDGFSYTFCCPCGWKNIGKELEKEYPENSWVYENLELQDYAD